MMNKKLIAILLLVTAAIFLASRTICVERCTHYPINRFPPILETIEDDNEQLDTWREIKEIRLRSFTISGILEYSKYHFITDQSLNEVISFLNNNGCEVIAEKEYVEYSAFDLELICNDRGKFFLTYYEQEGTNKFITTFERLSSRNSLKEIITCCFSSPN